MAKPAGVHLPSQRRHKSHLALARSSVKLFIEHTLLLIMLLCKHTYMLPTLAPCIPEIPRNVQHIYPSRFVYNPFYLAYGRMVFSLNN